MKRIYKLTDGIATDLQRVRDDWPIPAGFIVEEDDTTLFSQQLKSLPAAWEKKQAEEKDKSDLEALRKEAIEHFMRGETMPADKVQTIKAIDARLKAKNG